MPEMVRLGWQLPGGVHSWAGLPASSLPWFTHVHGRGTLRPILGLKTSPDALAQPSGPGPSPHALPAARAPSGDKEPHLPPASPPAPLPTHTQEARPLDTVQRDKRAFPFYFLWLLMR